MMKKIGVVILVLAFLAGSALFGVMVWARSTARAELETALANLTQAGATVSHGTIGFKLFSRTLTVPDLIIRSPDGGQILKAERVVARGVSRIRNARIFADTLEITGFSITLTDATTRQNSTYEMPLLRLTGFSGPAQLTPTRPSLYPNLTSILTVFGALSATRLEIPDLATHVLISAQDPQFVVDTRYTNFEARDVAEGRIATLSCERITFASHLGPEARGENTHGQMEQFEATRIDTTAVLDLVAPRTAQSSGYRTFYEQITAAHYTFTQATGAVFSADSFKAERLRLDPTRFPLQKLMDANALSGATKPLSPTEAADMADLLSQTLQSIAFTTMAYDAVNVTDATGTVRMSHMAFENFQQGRLDRMRFEGLVGTTGGQKPVALDRLVFTGLDFPLLFSASARLRPASKAAPDDTVAALFRILTGIEVTGLRIGQPEDPASMSLDHLDLALADVIGLFPTRATFTLRGFVFPTQDMTDASILALAPAGSDRAKLNVDLALVYDQSQETLRLTELRVTLDQTATLLVQASLTHLPMGAFQNQQTLMDALLAVAPGPVMVRLTDQGLVERMIAQSAKSEGRSPQAARAQAIDQLMSAAQKARQDSEVVVPLAQAVADFLTAPGTLTVTATPKANVALIDIIQTAWADQVRAFTFTAVASPSR